MKSACPPQPAAVRRSVVATACLLALASAPLLARTTTSTDDDATTTLDGVQVNAYRPAQTASASTKTDTPVLETPQSVSVITREELDARGVRNLNEATRYNAGVLAESQGIDNRVDDVYIRGFDAGSWSDNVTLDGMRAPQGGAWTRPMFDTWNMERVEVLKGPSAVLYGQVAPGGMVNQVSKTPTLDQQQVVQAGVDNYGRYQTAFDTGAANQDQDVLWRLVGLYSDGDTQIKHVSREHWFLAPSVTLRFNDDATRLTLLGMYQKDDGGSTFQFLPYEGTMEPAAHGYIKNTTFLGEPDWNVYDRTIYTAGWLFEHHFNDHWTLHQGGRFTHVDSLYRTTVAGVAALTDGELLARRAVQGQGHSDGRTLDTRLEGKFDTSMLTHTVLAGVDYQQADWTFLRKAAKVNANTIAINIFDPVYTYYDFASVLVNQISTAETDRQTGAYLQDQIAAGNWRFTLGGRYDWAKIDTLNRLTEVSTRTDNEAFTGRAGVIYLFDDGLAPYLSYSESFQPATGTDRQGKAFDPTTGKQWEAGVKYQPAAIDGMLTLSVYDLRQQNVLTTDPLNDGDETYQVQTGEVRVRGVELEGRVTPLTGFSVIGAVTRMDSEITHDNDGDQGNRMIRVPDWMGSLWLDYTFQAGPLQGFALAAGVRYVGQTYGDTANIYSIPSYTLYDAALRYDAGQFGPTHVQFSINGSNLADKRYVATCTAATACYYGSGRSVTANARFSW